MKKTGKIAAVLFALMLGIMALGVPSFASDDNSLASLGINTEGVTVTPDFAYDTWEYNVTVPAGTTELSLSPIPSSSAATIAGLSGTTLNADGTGTVYITVQAGNGDQFTYTLYVTGGGPAPQPQQQQEQEQEVQTPATDAPQPETSPQTEAQTEDNKYVRVERNTIQEAENTITNLKTDITRYRDTISMYTKIMYGLIAVAVVLLFIVINLILKKKDLKAELNEYRSLGYSNGKKAQKVQAAVAYGQQEMKERQNHPQPQSRTVPAQEDVHYTNGGQLDVRPQTSQKKSRRLPEYQGDNAGAAAQAEAGAVMQKQAPVKPQKPSRKQMQEAQRAEEARLAQEAAEAAAKAGQQGKGSQVQVDMIDL